MSDDQVDIERHLSDCARNLLRCADQFGVESEPVRLTAQTLQLMCDEWGYEPVLVLLSVALSEPPQQATS